MREHWLQLQKNENGEPSAGETGKLEALDAANLNLPFSSSSRGESVTELGESYSFFPALDRFRRGAAERGGDKNSVVSREGRGAAPSQSLNFPSLFPPSSSPKAERDSSKQVPKWGKQVSK